MKVPVLEPMQVAPAVGPTPNTQIRPPGGYDQVAEGLAHAGNAIDQTIERVKHAQHEAEVADARDNLTGLGNQITDVVHGTQTPTSQQAGDAAFDGQTVNQQGAQGFLSLRGKAAVAAAPDTMDTLEDLRQKRAASMKGETGRKIFLQQSGEMLEQTHRAIESHVGQQIEQTKLDALSAAEDEAVRASSVDPANDDVARQRIADVVGAAHGMGRDDDWTNTKTLEVQQKVATSRVATLVDAGNWKKADEVLQASRWALGDRAAPLEKAIEVAKAKNVGEDLASHTLETARKPNGFIDEAKAIATFGALAPDQRVESKPAFDHALELAREQEKSVKSNQFDGALSAYLKGHNLNDVPPTTKAWMLDNDPKGWHQLEQVVHADREHAKGTPTTEEQKRAFVQFDVDLKDHPDKYATMSEAQFHATVWPNLSNGDRERAGALFAGAHAGVDKAGKLSPDETHMLLEAGRRSRIFPDKQNDVSKWDDDSAQLYYKASETLRQQAIDHRKAHGEPPDPKTVQGWVDALVQEGKIPGTGIFGHFQTGTTRLEAITKGTEFTPAWNDQQRASAAKALQKSGMPADDDNIDKFLRIKNNLSVPPARAPDTPDATAGDYGLDLSEPEGSGAPKTGVTNGRLRYR